MPKPPSPPGFTARLLAFRERHAKAEIAVFFGAGFLFDIVTLDRIDSAFSIAQQVVYLSVLGLLLLYGLKVELNLASPPKLVAKAWRFHEDVVHFLLGSLLSVFSLFYFKSAAGLSTLLFMAAMFGVLVANELPRFRRFGHVARIALWGFCVFTFFSYAVPVAAGFLSVWLFVASLALSLSVGAGLFFKAKQWAGAKWAVRRVALPYGAVHALVILMYLARAIPALPLHVTYVGVYHDIQREAGKYRLYHQRPEWKIWEKGDQTFYARPGDQVYVFFQVWAPSRFKDRVKVRWELKDPKAGWRTMSLVPLSFSGGRAEGFRTYSRISNWKAGRWRASIETDDERVIGSIYFRVIEDASTEPRTFLEDEA